MRRRKRDGDIMLKLTFGEILRLERIFEYEIAQDILDKSLYLKIKDGVQRSMKKIAP